MLRLALHFGAGNIGRGFIGQIYAESGYEIVFVDVVEPLVQALNTRGAYPLHIVSDEGTETLEIRPVRGIVAGDVEHVTDTVAQADIVSTAVGIHALPYIAPLLALGIEKRFTQQDMPPLNVLICENILKGQTYLRDAVAQYLEPNLLPLLDTHVGFVEASIGRMVPVVTPEQRAQDILAVWVEPYCELPVDAQGFRGDIPTLKHLKPAENFSAYVERKLFVHNLTHAATAYLGYLRGHTYVYEAIRDGLIREKVYEAGRETCLALARKHGTDIQLLEDHLNDLIKRYHNRALADQIERVGRDPKRKLGPNDRLVGAMRLCMDYGVEPHAVALVTAAAIMYDTPSDPVALDMQRMRCEKGLDYLFQEVCNLSPNSREAEMIRESVPKLNEISKEL